MSEDKEDVSRLLQRIEQLEHDHKQLWKRTKPDEIAKAVDSSYLSIHNLRAMLQILAIVITIFLAGAVGLGVFGVKNIFAIHEQAQEVAEMRDAVRESLDSAINMEKSFEAHATALQAARTEFLSTSADVRAQASKLEGEFTASLSKVQKQSDEKIAALDRQLGDRLVSTQTEIDRTVQSHVSKTKEDVEKLRSELRSISEIFNKIGVSQERSLSAREQQMLVLLAKEIDPANPVFNFNAAHSALLFRRYDEAIQYLDVAMESTDLPPDIRKRAKDLREQAKKMKADPPKLEYRAPSGPSVGPYGIFEFPLNILDALVRNGYISMDQAQEILEASKRK